VFKGKFIPVMLMLKRKKNSNISLIFHLKILGIKEPTKFKITSKKKIFKKIRADLMKQNYKTT
jgi:hypothetical protein